MEFGKLEIDLMIALAQENLFKTIRELSLMDESSEHFFVNEGLLNEVRHESKKLLARKAELEALINKLHNADKI